MGWYDAYKPTNVSRVNVDKMGSNSGSAAKGLGDAFTSIGDSMLKVDKARDDEKTNKFINAYRDAQTTGVKKSNKAFDTTNELKNKKIEADTGYTNANTNLTGKKVKAFDTTNELKNKKIEADTGYTNANTGLISKKLNAFDKNNEINQNNTKAKTAYTQKQTDEYDKLLDSKIAKNDKSFKYTEKTDAKIASQVKTAMGMDAPNFNFDDSVKKAYQDTVAGSAQISKKYNLEPSLAIEVYANRDKYDFSGSKLTLKKEVKEPKKETKKSWKDYQ